MVRQWGQIHIFDRLIQHWGIRRAGDDRIREAHPLGPGRRTREKREGSVLASEFPGDGLPCG